MPEDRVNIDINLQAAQALAALKELNASVTNIPEKIDNANRAMQAFSEKTGLSLGAVETKFKAVGADAERLATIINGVNPNKLELTDLEKSIVASGAGQPFGDLGPTAGYKAAAAARREAVTLAAQEARSEAAVAEEINAQRLAEEKRLSLSKQISVQIRTQLDLLKQQGALNLTGSKNNQIEQLKSVIGQVSKSTGAQYHQVANELEKMGVPAAQANAAVKGLNAELTRGTRAAQGFRHGIDVIRTALGTLLAVGIFQFITSITSFFHGATEAARQFEDSLYRLQNVERELSTVGIEISMKGLQKGISDLKKEFPIFSKEDLTGLVGNLAIKTKDLRYSEEQILDLAEAIAILNVRSTEVETLDQTTSKVVTALLSGTTKGISGLGLQMDDATIVAEAMAENLLDAGEGIENLSKQEKDLVKLNIVLKSVGGEIITIQEYMKSSTGIIQQNTAAWKDLQAQVGTLLTAITPLIAPILNFFEDGFIAGKSILAVLNSLGAVIPTVLGAWKELFSGSGVDGFIAKLKSIPDEMKNLLKIKINDFFPQAPDSPLFEKLFGSLTELPETPTSPALTIASETEKAADAIKESEDKILDIMAEARDKRAQIDEDYRRKIEDANRDHAQKLQDIARDVERKQDDALRNYNQKVEDINRDANEKIAEANRDAKQKEIDREREYQNRLRELRERFLFDLEDALRERDARQVLRLIREYNMDKKNLEERRKLDRQESKKDLAQKLADIERDRQLKLEAARRELAEKQAEIALWAERERQDAQIALARKLADAREWHRRELAEYQQYLQRKLQELAKAIVKEYQLTAAGAQAIYSLLNGYFGSSGSISQLLANGLSANLGGILNSTANGLSSGGTSSTWSSLSSTWAKSGMYGAAEGGTFVATRPTTVMFGEKGPEMASFTPLGRTGADVGKMFSDTPISGNTNSMSLRIALSPDLIAEVVDSTLDSVAVHIERTRREK